jgi:hypothetical protein
MKRSFSSLSNSNGTTTILSLPEEVLGRILELLGLVLHAPLSLVSCRRVSQLFRRVADERISDVAWGRMAFHLKNSNSPVHHPVEEQPSEILLDAAVRAWSQNCYFGVDGRLLFQAFYVTKFLSRCDNCQMFWNFGASYSPLFGRNICRNCGGQHYYYGGGGGAVLNKTNLTKTYGVSGDDMERFGLESLQFGSSRLYSQEDAKIVQKLKARGIKSI